MSDIFLSYARKDLDKAKQLASALEKQGWSVFWDSQLLAGQQFHKELENEIQQASCMVVVWSSASIISKWVLGEANEGQELDILVPIKIDDSKPPLNFRGLHTENFSNWDGNDNSAEFLKLKKAVERLAGSAKNKSSHSVVDEANPIIVTSDRSTLAPEPRKPEAQTSNPIKSNTPKPAQTNNKSEFIEPEMVLIPAGSFQMGSNDFDNEKPIHTVTIAKPFLLGKYCVTFDEYDCFAKAKQMNLPNDYSWGRGQRPVINVNWQQAVDYANWLSEQTGKRYRIPSEAEWEYAAQANTTPDYDWDSLIEIMRFGFVSDLDNFAWYEKNAGGKTHPVGEKQPNDFGLHDMAGNVWEWTQDVWHSSYVNAPKDGSAWVNGDDSYRVIRGGSWNNNPRFLRSAYRHGNSTGEAGNYLGFRVAQGID